jgi:flagellar biosynthetic protein FliQ
MNILQAVEMLRQLILTSLLVVGPILFTGMAIGIAISLFQSVTSIQEPTLSFVPKLLGIGLVMVITAPWVLRNLMQFTISFISRLPEMVS